MDILELIHLDSVEDSEKPFRCTWPNCVKGFSRRSDLSRHGRIHTNDKPFVCQALGCAKSFIQRSALTVHQRTHSGERPHACEYAGCSKAFSDSSSLARHRRIHTGNRPYKCKYEDCGKSFCRKSILTKHLKDAHRNRKAPRRTEFDSRSNSSSGSNDSGRGSSLSDSGYQLQNRPIPSISPNFDHPSYMPEANSQPPSSTSRYFTITNFVPPTPPTTSQQFYHQAGSPEHRTHNEPHPANTKLPTTQDFTKHEFQDREFYPLVVLPPCS